MQTNHSRRDRERGMSTVSLVLLVSFLGGLLLGPGHIVYCLYFSGASAAEHPWTPGEEVTFSLSPEQNPLRLNAEFDYVPPRGVGRTNRRTDYEGELSGSGGTLWRERFSASYSREKSGGTQVHIGGSSTITTNIRLFSVDEAGDYTFRAKQSGERSLKIRAITLELRENVAEVNTAVAATGCVLAFGAFVSVVFGAGFRGRRRDGQGADGEPEGASAD
jgi:hypothetical protein